MFHSKIFDSPVLNLKIKELLTMLTRLKTMFFIWGNVNF